MADTHNFKTGDLVQVLELADESSFVYRPPNFPFGKIGIVVQISKIYGRDVPGPWYESEEWHPRHYAFDYYSTGHLWADDELVEVLVEGRKWWVFPDEIEFYTK